MPALARGGYACTGCLEARCRDLTWRGRFLAGSAVAVGGRAPVRACPWPVAPTACRAVTGAGQPLAVALALAASVCFAVAAVTQQRAAARLPCNGRSTRRCCCGSPPAGLAGRPGRGHRRLRAAGRGAGPGPLAVIEPVLATSLLFALALAARRDRRRRSRAEWAAALAVVAGLAVFLAAGDRRRPAHRGGGGAGTGRDGRGRPGWRLHGAGLLLSCPRRALPFGIGGGGRRGDRRLVKSVAVVAAGHVLSLAADFRLHLLIAVGLLAFTIQQNGYRAAGLAAFLPRSRSWSRCAGRCSA